MAEDQLKVLIQAIADEKKSSDNIIKQLPEIEKLINAASKIKIQIEADTSTLKNQTSSIGKQLNAEFSKMSSGIDLTSVFKFNNRDMQTLYTQLEAYVKKLNSLSGFKDAKYQVRTIGDTNTIDTATITYFNEKLHQTVAQTFKLDEANEEAVDSISKMSLASTRYTSDITGLENAQKRLVEQEKTRINLSKQLVASSDLLRTKESKSSLSLDWGEYDKAFSSGNLKQAKVELDLLQKKYQALNASLSKKLPQNAIENLPASLKLAKQQVDALQYSFDKLKMKGVIVPDGVLQQLEQIRKNMSLIDSTTDDEAKIKQYNKLRESIIEVNGELKKAKQSQDLFNTQAGMDKAIISANKLSLRIENLKTKYSAFTHDKSLMGEWQNLFDSSKVVKTKEEVSKLAAEVGVFEQKLEKAGKRQLTFSDTIAKAFKKFSEWILVGTITMQFIRSIQQMITNVKNLDAGMVELKKVTDETDATYSRFLDRSIDKAIKLGTTISDLVKATADFARMGYGIDDALKLAEVANIYYRVGDGIESIDDASQSVISTMKAFNISSTDSLQIIDLYNEIGNRFAVTSGDIGKAMQTSGAALATSNNSLSQSVALWTAMNEILQDESMSATALRFITQRMRNTAGELEDMGEDADGAAESITELQQKVKGLTGVDIMSDADTFRDTYSVLKDISKVWNDITDKERADVIRLMAGTRQSAAFSSLMLNFSTAEEVMNAAADAEGSAMEEHAKWMDSIAAKQQQFTANFEALSNAVLNSSLVKFTYDAGSGILGFLTAITEKLGVLPMLMTAASGILSAKSNFGISNVKHAPYLKVA